MTTIFIDPAKNPLAIRIKLNSMQNVSYDVSVRDSLNNKIEEYSGVLDNKNDTAVVQLKSSSYKYKDCFVNGIFTIGDLVGAGNYYKIDFSILQNGTELAPKISLSGKTTANDITRYPQFHLI